MREKMSAGALFACLLVFPAVVLGQEKSEGWLWKSKDKDTEVSTTTNLPTLVPITQNDLEFVSNSSDIVDLELDDTTEASEVVNGTSEVSGRSAKAFRFGQREARILNDSGKKNKLNIKGYIPIVSLDDRDKDDDDDESGSPYPPQPIPGRPILPAYQPPRPVNPSQLQPAYLSPQTQPGQFQTSYHVQRVSNRPVEQTFPVKPLPNPAQYPESYPVKPNPAQYPNPYPVQPLPSQSGGPYRPVQSGAPIEEYPSSISRPIVDSVQPSVAYIPQNNGYGQRPGDSFAGSSVQSTTYLPNKPIPQNPVHLPTSSSEYNPVRKPVIPQPNYPRYQGINNNGDFGLRNPKRQESINRPVAAGPTDNYQPAYQDQKAKFAHAVIPGGYNQQGFQEAAFSEVGPSQEPCLCVPFYLCKNGFLASSAGRNTELQEPIDERSVRKNVDAAVDVDARSFEKPEYVVDSKNVTLNDSVAAKVKRSVNDSEVPAYAKDVMSRFVGANSCGLLRRCCRIPPPGGVPAGYEEVPPQFQELSGSDVVSDFNPQFLPDNFAGVPQQPQIHPQQGGFGGFPSQGGYIHPSQLANRPSYQASHIGQNRPIPEYVEESVGPVHRPPVGHVSGFGPGTVYPKPSPGSYPGQFIHRPSIGAGIHGGTPSEAFIRPHGGRPYPGAHQAVYPGPQLQPKPFRQAGVCGARNAYGIHGRVKNLNYHEDSTDFGEYPWQVAILKKIGPGDSLYVCGGTLISSQWVATAAHCLKKYNVQDLKLRLGEWDVHRDDEFYPYVEKLIGEAIVHPDFFPGNLKNDIALIRLDTPVDLNQPHIATACLPEPQENFAGKKCHVTGWGKDGFGARGEYQNVLKEVDLPVLDFQDCEYRMRQTRLGPSYQLHPGFLCAGGEPGKDACTGDGGSPLVCESHGVWKVAGLVSWGIGCGQPGVPGVYVNMAHFRDWVESIIGHYG